MTLPQGDKPIDEGDAVELSVMGSPDPDTATLITPDTAVADSGVKKTAGFGSSTFNLTNSIIGAGILALPYTFMVCFYGFACIAISFSTERRFCNWIMYATSDGSLYALHAP